MNAVETTTGRPGGEAESRPTGGRTSVAAGGGPDPAAPRGEVCDQILSAHHDPLSASLPRIRLLLFKVADAHGPQYPELYRVLAGFDRFATELAQHLSEEDRVLFPLVGRVDAGEGVTAELAGELEAADAAHTRIGAALDELASLADGFEPPADACDAYRMAMGELRDLAAGVRRAVAEENEVLFVRLAGRRAGVVGA